MILVFQLSFQGRNRTDFSYGLSVTLDYSPFQFSDGARNMDIRDLNVILVAQGPESVQVWFEVRV